MNGNESAYPQGHLDGPGIDPSGLSKRELIAAMAMQGLLANHRVFEVCTGSDIINTAVIYADDLLAELAKEK